MKLFNTTKRISILFVLMLWAAYAVVNAARNGPSLVSAYHRSWGIGGKLNGIIETADGKILFQSYLQDRSGEIRTAFGMQSINNFKIIRAANGQLLYTNFYPYAVHDYKEAALKMQQLARFSEEKEISFTYVSCIDMFNEETGVSAELPVNNMNPRSDSFLHTLGGYGVDCLDSRIILKNSPLSPDRYTYLTEPHWTTEAAFEVYRALVKQLDESGGALDTEGFYTSASQYKKTEYKQSYLGKIGKIAGAPYSGYDDFTLISPIYGTDFTLSFAELDDRDSVRGGFTDTLLDERWLNQDDPYANDMYSAYLSEVYPFRCITNNLNPNGEKILMIGDSFMLPVTAFLANTAGQIHLLSPYSLPYGISSLEEYIENNDFDHVIVGLNPGTLSGDGFNFLNGIQIPQVPDDGL